MIDPFNLLMMLLHVMLETRKSAVLRVISPSVS